MNKEIIIFTGISISKKEGKEILDADYRNPVKRGDILKAISDSPKIIGIIDGVFHQYPAVSHKEILKAIENGIIVVGGGSMGALRASELDTLGMKGIGYVYENYSEGLIESDDDVAVVFNPKTGEPFSEALINIEYKMNSAIKEQIIDEEEKEEIINIGKSIYYPHRTYDKIFEKSSLDDERKEKLKDLIKKETDIKKKDAIAVLKYIKSIKY